jgi:hypothetical protein
MIDLYKKAGRWIENDAYTPQAGDIIFYDWQDNGTGDNVGSSDHVGIVISVNGTNLKIIEGNISDSVGYRNIKINGKYIRGYGIPDYGSKADGTTAPPPVAFDPSPYDTVEYKYNIGDIVKFVGSKHYIGANSVSPKICKPGTAKVTAHSKNSKHPYHLVAERGKGSNVYGWVDESDIAEKRSSTSGNNSGVNTVVDANIKIEPAKSFLKSLEGTYKTTVVLNMRAGAGTSKTVLTVIPKGEKVTCYGYYTIDNGIKWYYVNYKNSKGNNFVGFVSSKYLKS